MTTDTTNFDPHASSRLASYARVAAALCMALGMMVGLAATGPQAAQAQDTYTVNSNGDAGDADDTDGSCATSGGDCTLRAAIEQSNADSDSDTIEFGIPATGTFATITVNSELQIDESVTIDGTTANTYPSSVEGPVIEIRAGSNLGNNADGFAVNASDVTIRAMGISNFPEDGVEIFPGATGVTVEECFIGIAIDDGESNRGNGQNGVLAAGDNFLLDRNVISHNSQHGVEVEASTPDPAKGLANNIIGLDYDGDAAAGNSDAGVRISGGSDVDVGIFALFAVAGNYISANGGPGIAVESPEHTILGNFIGTDSTGSTVTGTGGASLGNDGAGIEVLDDNTVINGNIISGNDNGITIGNNNTSADSTIIENNTVGLNDAEDTALPNGTGASISGGILCFQSSASASDDATIVELNTIAGNDGQGIWMTDNCYDWDILDNYIGTNFNFDTGLGNEFNGVNVKSNPSGNGEEVDVVENIIGANDRDGVDLRGGYHDVSNNYIGVAPDGTDLGNGSQGVIVHRANTTDVQIGDTVSPPGNGDAAGGNSTPSGDGNVIGYNGDDGILIQGDASGIPVTQNYVGTDPSDADYGNGGDGIRIKGDGNPSTAHNIGYSVGSTIPSDPSPSAGGFGNVVAYNAGDGISLGSSESSTDVGEVSVRGNTIYQNGGNTPQLGIDLGNSGQTSNDPGDGDSGPNNLQNFPNIQSVNYNSGNSTVTIDYDVPTNSGNADFSSPLKVDFYAADSEQSGEGKIYLGTQDYSTANATNVVSFDLSNFSNVTKDDYFVATVTDASGNTSEFFGPPGQQLPVELASFEGTQTGEGAVKLTWTTASEQNNSGFEIQRRDVGSAASENASENASESGSKSGAWETVDFVESKAAGGTTTEAKTYRFPVEGLSVGTHQFRLRQKDLDGSAHAHDPVTVELQMQEALHLGAPAPNPVSGRATLSFAVREQAEATLTLYNTLGQRVATLYRGTPQAGEQETTQIDATGLSSGTYFLRLRANGQTQTQSLTIVR